MKYRPTYIRKLALERWAALSILLGLFAEGLSATVPPPTRLPPISGHDPPFFTTLGTEQGLSNGMVRTVVQDRYGFLWIGTEDGLNRYDGYMFRTFNHDPADPQSISDDFIWCSLADRSGNLWIGTGEGGLNRYDSRTGRFDRFQHNPRDPGSLSHDDVRCVYEDRAGGLWVGTCGGGLNYLALGSRRFLHYVNVPGRPESLGNNAVLSIVEDDEGALWLGTQNGLDCYDRATGRFRHFRNDPHNPRSLAGNDVVVLEMQPDGRLLAGTNEGLSFVDRASGLCTSFRHDPADPASLSHNRILSAATDAQGDLWVGTLMGLNRLRRGTTGFERFLGESQSPGALQKDMILCLYQDRLGNVWVGTAAGGVCRYSAARQKFTTFRRVPGNPAAGLSHDVVRSIYRDREGILWVGTLKGCLNRYDPLTRRFTHLNIPEGAGDPGSTVTISAILEDRQGAFWLGTWESGLKRYDRRTGAVVTYRHDPGRPGSISSDLVQFLFEDRHGNFWVGTQEGLNRLDRATGEFTVFRNDPANPRSLSDNSLQSQAVCEDAEGFLWIGTWKGLNRFDPRTGACTRFTHDERDPQSLSDNQVISLRIDDQGRLWVGTYGGGLNRMDKPGRFSRLGTPEGLPNNVVYGILNDARGRLWLSTNKGLARYDPQSGAVRVFDVSDGLQGNQFFWGAAFKSANGEMFFGGNNGFSVFFPDLIQDSGVAAPLVLTGFSVLNKRAAIGAPLEEMREVNLSWQENFLAFEFAALDLTAPERIRYEYMLEGFDSTWIRTSADRRIASYTNLPSGSYVLRIRSTNGDGVWNDRCLSVAVVIAPPFWRTRWAYSLYTVLAVGLVFGLARFLSRRHHGELARRQRELEDQILLNERLKKVDRLKNDFISNVSHELKTPLTSIMGFAAIARKKLQETILDEAVEIRKRRRVGEQTAENMQIILDESNRMMSLIQDLLDLDELESGLVLWQSAPVDMALILEEVLGEFKPRAALRNIEVVERIPPDLPRVTGDGARLVQVVKKLLDNALKFSPDGGMIAVSAERLPFRVDGRKVQVGSGALMFTFANTGEGISAEDRERIFEKFGQTGDTLTSKPRGAGLGLPIARVIVARHGGRIWCQPGSRDGTVFCFTLPTG